MAGSLGTLTLDLIAKIGGFTGPLDKASQEAKKRNAEIAKSFDSLAKGVGVAIGSIPAVITGVVIASADAAKEIGNLSALAGLSTTEFQKMAAGSRSVGVDQEKLADILKDTNDKLGDFINTGGGALKDFFTNIAPMVGVTAEQFKKLNSRDALALYVTSLEKANVSQAEMTFYMEAIASDSTALVPLLRNNAQGFTDLGAAADAAGVIMNDTTIAAAKQFGFELDSLLGYVKSVQISLAAEFSPLLLQVSKDLKQAAIDAGGVGPAIKKSAAEGVEAIAFIVDAGDGVGRVFKIISAEFDGLVSSAAGSIIAGVYQTLHLLDKLPGVDLSSQLNALEQNYNSQVEAAADATNRMRAALETPLAGTAFLDYYKRANENAKELLKTTNAITQGTGSGVDPAAIAAKAAAEKKAASEAAAAAKKIQDTFKSTETDYQRQIELINTTSDKRKDATEVAKLQFEIESGKLVGINSEQQKRLEGLAAELDVKLKLKKANEDAAKLAAFDAALRDNNQTVKEGFDIEIAGSGSGDKLKDRLKADLAIRLDFEKQQADLQKQYNGGDISQEMYDRETEMLQEALAERMVLQQDYYNQIDEAQSNWVDGVSSAWENYRDTATNFQQQAADATASILDGTTNSIADNIESLVKGQESIGDFVSNIAAGMANATIQALSQMAAQWIVYKGVQLVLGQTGSAAAVAQAAITGPAIAAAYAPAAALASLASFGTNSVPAIAGIAATTTAAESAALLGMAHDGIDSVPQTGTWLLQKGERVTTAETSAKLDKTLEQVRSDRASGSSSPTLNIIEDASRAGQQRTRLSDDQLTQVIDVFVSNIYEEGKAHDAMNRKYGLRGVGT